MPLRKCRGKLRIKISIQFKYLRLRWKGQRNANKKLWLHFLAKSVGWHSGENLGKRSYFERRQFCKDFLRSLCRYLSPWLLFCRDQKCSVLCPSALVALASHWPGAVRRSWVQEWADSTVSFLKDTSLWLLHIEIESEAGTFQFCSWSYHFPFTYTKCFWVSLWTKEGNSVVLAPSLSVPQKPVLKHRKAKGKQEASLLKLPEIKTLVSAIWGRVLSCKPAV